MQNYNRLSYIFLIITLLITAIANAQKLPPIQTISLRAPSDIKVDGKLDEWGGKLQADNHVNRIFYTVSNDDEKLYLSILITDHHASEKLFNGGLTFTISHSTTNERKKDVHNSVITYPLTNRNINPKLRGYFMAFVNSDNRSTTHLDSLVELENNSVKEALTKIQVTGLKAGIDDTILPIDNKQGVNACLLFSKGMVCTYELAIPLKYLGLSVNDPVKFSYNIKLNGDVLYDSANAPPPPPTAADGEVSHDIEFVTDATDFWGEYILAKKP